MQDRKLAGRTRRRRRVRKKIYGTDQRPRLSVFRSTKHIYAQVISDQSGKTLAATSTLSEEVRDHLDGKKRMDVAREIGRKIAEICKLKGIEQVVFDRGAYRYHGRVRALAEGAREGKLGF